MGLDALRLEQRPYVAAHALGDQRLLRHSTYAQSRACDGETLAHNGVEIDLRAHPAHRGNDDQAPLERKRLEIAREIAGGDDIEDHVHAPAVRLLAHHLDEILDCDNRCRERPQAFADTRLLGVPAVANTRAPRAVASWIAVVPIPLVPPWTSTSVAGLAATPIEQIGPDREKGFGIASGLDRRAPWGPASQRRRGDRILGIAPPASSAVTLSPSARPTHPGPSATTSPAISRPGISEAPAGGG